jgi:hypothetical protein
MLILRAVPHLTNTKETFDLVCVFIDIGRRLDFIMLGCLLCEDLLYPSPKYFCYNYGASVVLLAIFSIVATKTKRYMSEHREQVW